MLSSELKPIHILNIVCDVCRVDVKRVRSGDRKKEFAQARHIYSYISCQYGFQNNAHLILGQDHASVTHGKNKIEGFITQPAERETRNKISEINLKLSVYKKILPCVAFNRCKYEGGFKIPTPQNQKGTE